MTINDQIEAAWKEELPKVRESLQCSRASQVLGAAEIGFAAGYRAALRRLYVEVKPEECAEYGAYWIEVDGDCWEATFRKDKTGDYFDIKDVVSNSEVEIECVGKVYRLSIPSPAEVFGEGV